MAIRIRNERQPDKTLSLATYAWTGILELAVDYGWNPLGAVLPGHWHQEIYMDSYYPGSTSFQYEGVINRPNRLVLLEDALNLADALEDAFLDYEPVRVPASYYLFEPEDSSLRLRPSLGAITSVIDFCRLGPFWVERHRRPLT